MARKSQWQECGLVKQSNIVTQSSIHTKNVDVPCSIHTKSMDRQDNQEAREARTRPCREVNRPPELFRLSVETKQESGVISCCPKNKVPAEHRHGHTESTHTEESASKPNDQTVKTTSSKKTKRVILPKAESTNPSGIFKSKEAQEIKSRLPEGEQDFQDIDKMIEITEKERNRFHVPKAPAKGS